MRCLLDDGVQSPNDDIMRMRHARGDADAIMRVLMENISANHIATYNLSMLKAEKRTYINTF